MSRVPILAASLLLCPMLSAAQVASPSDDRVPVRVSRYAEAVWVRLLDTLDVEGLLRPACKEVAAHTRRSPADAPMDRDLLATLSDQEVCDTVIQSATAHFQLMAAGLARVPIEDASRMPAGGRSASPLPRRPFASPARPSGSRRTTAGSWMPPGDQS